MRLLELPAVSEDSPEVTGVWNLICPTEFAEEHDDLQHTLPHLHLHL